MRSSTIWVVVLASLASSVVGSCSSDPTAEESQHVPGTDGGDAKAGSSGTGGTGGAAGSTGGSGVGGAVGGSSGSPPVDECSAPGADWIFCSGFEEGSKAIWDDYDGNPDSTNLLIEDPGPRALGGNHIMRLRVPSGRGGADLVKVLPSEHDKLYARWYIKYEPGFDFSAPNHGGGLHAGSRNLLGRSDFRPDGSDWYTGWVEHTTDSHVYNVYSYYRGMYMDCADPSGQCWGDHFPCMADQGQTYCTNPAHRPGVVPPTLQNDTWYCVELMMDGGAASQDAAGASGQLDYWVDDQEVGPWSNLWFRTDPGLKLRILWLNLFHHAEHSVEGVMYDNVVVSKSRIGCL